MTYNGSSPGPTLILRPGDRLSINIENRLGAPTNLHTHGLHVSPEGNGDNVFIAVAPGESQTYLYDIPQDHRSGLFWYHPHAHGTVATQVGAGLAGAIIITDALDDEPELSNSVERLLILTDPSAATADPMQQMEGRQGARTLVNGVAQPQIDMRAGTRERWRILNASPSRYYQLELESHPFQVIGSDGGRLHQPRTVDHILLAPGERTELIVAPTDIGDFRLRSLDYDRGSTGMGTMMGGASAIDGSEHLIATARSTGRSEPVPLWTSVPGTEPIAALEPVLDRTFELGMGMGGASMMSFTINGRKFDPQRTDEFVASGSVERWILENPTSMDHPFHLHVWPFVVEGREAELGWKDTVNVPAGQTVSIVVPFAGHSGRTVYHCHILDHEDLGMMGIVEVAR